ncbi:MAG TPA: gamma carbonic anhydrase family protein, partial [Actinomycetota bacterium]|nr:gamma carbonic anhydrase family protein [Actinomycetota bacterium]
MLVEHRGARPSVHPTAYVAPNAVLCGDVRVGEDARVLFGAVLTAEDGTVEVGARCVVMEHALLRGRADHPVRIGDDVLVGPHAHVNGAEIGDGAFLATGVSVFPGARVGARAEVRVGAVVHVNSSLPPEATVPIGWVAVGVPAQVLPPERD